MVYRLDWWTSSHEVAFALVLSRPVLNSLSSVMAERAAGAIADEWLASDKRQWGRQQVFLKGLLTQESAYHCNRRRDRKIYKYVIRARQGWGV